jgi:hypothetical protein
VALSGAGDGAVCAPAAIGSISARTAAVAALDIIFVRIAIILRLGGDRSVRRLHILSSLL